MCPGEARTWTVALFFSLISFLKCNWFPGIQPNPICKHGFYSGLFKTAWCLYTPFPASECPVSAWEWARPRPPREGQWPGVAQPSPAACALHLRQHQCGSVALARDPSFSQQLASSPVLASRLGASLLLLSLTLGAFSSSTSGCICHAGERGGRTHYNTHQSQFHTARRRLVVHNEPFPQEDFRLSVGSCWMQRGPGKACGGWSRLCHFA